MIIKDKLLQWLFAGIAFLLTFIGIQFFWDKNNKSFSDIFVEGLRITVLFIIFSIILEVLKRFFKKKNKQV